MSEIYRWRNKINIYKQSVTNEIQPVHKDMEALRSELLSIKRFQKIKEVAEEIRDEHTFQLKGIFLFSKLIEGSNLSDSRQNFKTKKDHKRLTHYNDQYDGEFHRKTNLNIINDILAKKQDPNDNDEYCPYDPVRNMNSEQFFTDENIMNTNTQILIDKNHDVSKDTLTSKTGHLIGKKQYASREYVIMIKETIDEFRRKSNYLEELKSKLVQLEQKKKNAHSEVSIKVAERIYKNRAKLYQNDAIPESMQNSEFSTDAASNDERLTKSYIPTLNIDIERVLLFKQREREDSKNKLAKAKELVISACGFVGRICKEIRITNAENKEISVDVIENNISDYMSL